MGNKFVPPEKSVELYAAGEAFAQGGVTEIRSAPAPLPADVLKAAAAKPQRNAF